MNKVGEKKKYFKSQKRSGCNAHFQFGFLNEKEGNPKFVLHRPQSTPVFPEVWFLDMTFKISLIEFATAKQSAFNPGAEAQDTMQMMSPTSL